MHKAIGFPNKLDSDLSGRKCYPTFEQSGPEFNMTQENSYTTANSYTGLPLTKSRIAQFIITSLHEYKQNLKNTG